MRTYTLNVNLTDTLTPRVQTFAAGLEDKTQLHRSMGAALQQELRRYVRATVPMYHQTANALGGRPTGFVSDAADSITADGALSASDAMGQLTLNHPWLARAFGPLHIVPKTSKYLTIPARGEFYGHRAREFSNLKFSFRKSAGRLLPVLEVDLRQGGRVKVSGPNTRNPVAYWLLTSVDQDQDRDRLPPDETMQQALRTGGARWLRSMERQNRLEGSVA